MTEPAESNQAGPSPDQTPDDLTDAFGFRRARAWWHRHLDPEDRRRVMSDLAVSRVENWAWRFLIMLTLSVVVAVMGLTLDSAAVVIGAMLLAPLMQPVLATGACMSSALFGKALVALFKVTLATVWSIAVAYGLALALATDTLTSEVLARTSPNIQDLVVALAAGAAGAYATVREDVSSSLPGVAVAVALVPPLGAVGITLEAGDRALAWGALLLYLTNLTAIVAASIVVFFFTGFVTPRRLADNAGRLTLATIVSLALVVVIALPLYRTSIGAIEHNERNQTVTAIVDRWLANETARFEPAIDYLDRDPDIPGDKPTIVIELEGFGLPEQDEQTLIVQVQDAYPGYDVIVPITSQERATTTTLPPPEPSEQLLREIRLEVEAWLDETGIEYQIDDIRLIERQVRIDVAVVGPDRPSDSLGPRLSAIDPALVPLLTWTELTTISDTVPTPVELVRADLLAEVELWVEDEGLILDSFDYDGSRVRVDVIGSNEPEIVRLIVSLRRVADNNALPVEVFYTPRIRVTTTAPPTTSPQLE